MTPALDMFVAGLPAAQGSKAFKGMRGRHAVLVESSKALPAWREAVATAGRKHTTAMIEQHIPVRLSVVFDMPRGKTVTRDLPTTMPDLDKLLRAVGDALSGIAYHDDRQVVSITGHKRYADDTPGAHIVVHAYGKPGR